MTGLRALDGLEGTRIGGRFELRKLSGHGFVSVRYEALDAQHAPVTVSLLAGAVDRPLLDQELTNLVRVSHPGLLLPLEAGFDAELGCAFVIEPVADGVTLTEHVTSTGRLASGPAKQLVAELAGALAAVHAAGISHRALTSDCVFVRASAEGLVARIGGFADGFVQPDAAAIEADSDARLAPEIAEGQAGGVRSDVWALGALLHRIVDDAADVAIVELLAKSLADDPQQRPDDAAAFLRALTSATSPAKSPVTTGSISLDSTLEGAVSIGKRIGDYRILSLLGEGGMGAVYEVESREGAHFALKVIRAEALSTRHRRRFEREIKAARDLEGEHIARVLGSGTDPESGAPYMVMELLRGSDVSEIVKRQGPLAPAVAARIALEACEGLAEAHRRGLIHRDIKPSNLFLHEVDGRIVTKVCDFGIVKDSALGQANTVLTRTGALMGSPAYMSPEQSENSSSVDQRTDIWSLAASLYEMLSGAAPWEGAKNVGEILILLQTRDVAPLCEVAPWVSPELAAVVQRGLARERDARYASVDELHAALQPFADSQPLAKAALQVAHPAAASADRRPRPRITGATSTALQAITPLPRPKAARSWKLPALSIAGALTLIAAGLGAWRLTSSPPDVPTGSSAPTPVAVPPCDLESCIASNGGRASRCHPEHGCTALESEHCVTLADEKARRDPRTFWIGSMFPTGEKDPYLSDLGRASQQALELARRDFMSVSGGLPTRDGTPRPVGIVACDDASDAGQSAKHLVDVGVAGIVGFRSSKDVIALAQSEFIPHDTLIVPSLNSSTLITAIPHPLGSPRLVWRTAVPNTAAINTAAAFLADYVEPVARAKAKHPLKLLLLRGHDAVGLALSESVFGTVRLNGKSISENGALFRELSDDMTSDGASLRGAVTAALDHQPDVLIFHTQTDLLFDNFLEPLEKAWPSGQARPIYIVPGIPEGAALGRLLGRRPDLAQRLFGMTPNSRSVANLKFTSSYNATFNQKLPPSEAPGAPYDSFYLLAYAAYAADHGGQRGSDLARAIARLVPPGKPIDVGPAFILDAFGELDRGGNIDLRGSFSRMDFDLHTGESPADYAILCTRRSASPHGFESFESGMVYDAAEKRMNGTFSCK